MTSGYTVGPLPQAAPRAQMRRRRPYLPSLGFVTGSATAGDHLVVPDSGSAFAHIECQVK